MTTTDEFSRSAAALWPMCATHDAWRLIDGGNAALQAWVELQQALWQPWWDAQAEWLRQWTAAAGVPPAFATFAARGAEQLG